MAGMETVIGPTWQALISHETYGRHFSVSARRRKPTDDEVAEARAEIPDAAECDTEVTHTMAVNPYVRHFIAAGAVDRPPFDAVFRLL